MSKIRHISSLALSLLLVSATCAAVAQTTARHGGGANVRSSPGFNCAGGTSWVMRAGVAVCAPPVAPVPVPVPAPAPAPAPAGTCSGGVTVDWGLPLLCSAVLPAGATPFGTSINDILSTATGFSGRGRASCTNTGWVTSGTCAAVAPASAPTRSMFPVLEACGIVTLVSSTPNSYRYNVLNDEGGRPAGSWYIRSYSINFQFDGAWQTGGMENVVWGMATGVHVAC